MWLSGRIRWTSLTAGHLQSIWDRDPRQSDKDPCDWTLLLGSLYFSKATSNTIKKFERMFQWKSCEKPRLPRIYTQPIQSLYSTLIREIILQVRKLFIFLTTCVLFWLFYFILSLHFTPGLQSAVCILPSVCILPPVCSLQSAVCSLRFTLTGSWARRSTDS